MVDFKTLRRTDPCVLAIEQIKSGNKKMDKIECLFKGRIPFDRTIWAMCMRFEATQESQ